MRVEAKVGLISVFVIAIAAACGGRSEMFRFEDLGEAGSGGTSFGGYAGSINDADVTGGTGGGGTGGTAGTGTAGTGTAGTGTAGTGVGGGGGGAGGDTPDADVPDAPADVQDIFDVIPPIDGPIGDCVACLEEQCGEQINACYNNPTCVEGIQCTIINCAAGGGTGGAGGGSGGGGGGIDFQCMLGCFNNDMNAALMALSAFSCINESCGEDCAFNGGEAEPPQPPPSNFTGMPLPKGLFRNTYQPRISRSYSIGSTRVPRPEEVASAYPWLAELLSGRMPDPPPPCITKQRIAKQQASAK